MTAPYALPRRPRSTVRRGGRPRPGPTPVEGVEPRIAPALQALVVPMASIELHPRNPRVGDVEAIAASLGRFGQVRPVLVQASTRFVVAGNACQSDGVQPLSMNAVSLMLTRRYHAGGGSLRTFGSHRIRHATATLLVNNGMPLEEVSRYLGHSSTDVTRRYARQSPDALGRRAADALERAGLVGIR